MFFIEPIFAWNIPLVSLVTIRTIIRPSNPTTGHMPWGNHNSKRHMHPSVHCSTINIIQDNGSNLTFMDRWMDKEDVENVYKRILFSHKEEQSWVISRDVFGPRFCHTEWNKSERQNQISYINTYTWHLEKWYRWTYLQGRNRDTDGENKHIDMERGGWEWDELGDCVWYIYTSMCKIHGYGNLL